MHGKKPSSKPSKIRTYFPRGMHWSRAGVTLLLLCFCVSTQAQEENCGSSSSGKAQKLFEKGTDKKRYKKSERIRFLLDAIEADPEFAGPRWALSYITIRDAIRGGKSYNKVADDLEMVIQNCPEYHSSPYYYLGEIYQGKRKFDRAAEMYEKFLKFKGDSDDQYERKYEELRVDAKKDLEVTRFFAEQYANPRPFDPQRLVPLSTDGNDEYLPFISPDNQVMLFTRRTELKQNTRGGVGSSPGQVNYVERFSEANRTGNSFEQGEPLPPPFNQLAGANYGGACLSIDNKEIYLTVCQPNGAGYVNCDIVYSKKVYGVNPLNKRKEWHWTAPENLGPQVNTPDGWEAQPTLSRDGKMLLFASLREGSQGIDIYRSLRQGDGSWGTAENLGAPINTASHEKTPFFHSDKRTLYFASKGHLNFGGYDVFYSKFTDEGTWTDPMNLGHPINTEKDEHSYVVSTDGLYVYFASKQLLGTERVHLYSFELYPEARPEKVLVLKGSVKNEKGEVPKDAEVEIRNTANKRVEKFKVDSVEGSYTAIVNLEDSGDFVVNIQSKDVAFHTFMVSGKETDTYRSLDMDVETVAVGKPYRMENIRFPTNSAELTEDSKATLDAFADYLKKNQDIRVSVEGHTDNVGDAQANLALSTERAFSVLVHLQGKGIAKERLQFKGWGPAKPIASNGTPEGRARNRRTEFIILSR